MDLLKVLDSECFSKFMYERSNQVMIGWLDYINYSQE